MPWGRVAGDESGSGAQVAEAGWYPDPQDAGAEAYWDGVQWTGHRRPVAYSAAPQPYYGTQQPITQPYHLYATQWPPAPAPPRRRHRRLLLAAAVAVIVAAGGVTTWLAWPGRSRPTLTYHGTRIAKADADATLSKADAAFATDTRSRHGVTGPDTKCYFAQPTGKGASTDVDDSLFCGPVVFVDGDARHEYVTLPLTNTGSATRPVLTAAAPDPSAPSVAPPAGERLIRPDGHTAPKGNGGLTVPTPPAAKRDVITTATTVGGTQPKGLSDARMVGHGAGLQITSAGYVPRYGKGDDARSAPAGERLLAFQFSDLDGEVDKYDAASPTLQVSGEPGTRDIPTADPDEWVVAAIPTGSTATVQLTDSGLTQTLSLPGGRPGPHNLAVLARENRVTTISRTFTVPLRFTYQGSSNVVATKAVATSAYLEYWAPDEPAQHASGAGRALLSVGLTYSDPGQPGTKYAFETGLLRLELPDGTTVRARNVSADDEYLENVFDVPADLTTATVQIIGTATHDGVQTTVTHAASFSFTFPDG